MQRAGPTPVLSGEGRDNSGLVAILSRPTGVGGRECKTSATHVEPVRRRSSDRGSTPLASTTVVDHAEVTE